MAYKIKDSYFEDQVKKEYLIYKNACVAKRVTIKSIIATFTVSYKIVTTV